MDNDRGSFKAEQVDLHAEDVGLRRERIRKLGEIAARAAIINSRNHELKMEYLISAMSRDQIRQADDTAAI